VASETTRQMPRQNSTQNRQVSSTSKITNANPTRKDAVLELIGLATMPLALLSAYETVRMPEDQHGVSAYTMDVFAIDMHKEPIADAIVELADAYPVLGAMLDQVSKTTPFGGLLMACVGLALQIAENHKQLPETMHAFPGLIPREELAHSIYVKGEEMKAAAHSAKNGVSAA